MLLKGIRRLVCKSIVFSYYSGVLSYKNKISFFIIQGCCLWIFNYFNDDFLVKAAGFVGK